MSDELRLGIAYALVFIGSMMMTVGVYGLAWMPDLYRKMHAASKIVPLGLLPFLLAAGVAGDWPMVYRSILIAVFLLVTTPVASHAIARAAFLRGERVTAPDPLDESGSGAAEE